MKVAVISDSPKVHTGFGIVNRELCRGFHDAGMDVHVYGLLDSREDDENELPYNFYPTPAMDELGHRTFSFFLRSVKPDVIFILTDPGNLHVYLHSMHNKGVADYKRGDDFYRPTVVSYTPIEGSPAPLVHGDALMAVQQAFGGTCVAYCQAGARMIMTQFPDLTPLEIVHHGLDHSNFRRYSDDDRDMIRRLVGLERFFVVGSVGVNKRTKGFPTIIYAAQILKENGYGDDIKFYCHTNPHQHTMEGYKLQDLTDYHGVSDMFLWKQKIQDGYWMGIDRDNDSLERCRAIADQTIPTPEERGLLFTMFDMPTMYNCFDVYMDASQIEGWGLGVGESMACGVPAISVYDQHVREEIYSSGAYMITPQPRRVWDTWHSGMRLVSIDPKDVAEAILKMKNSAELREEHSIKGQEMASRYKWDDARNKMVKIVQDTAERHIKQWQEQES